MGKERDFFDKLLVVSQILSLIVIPLVIFIVGQNIEKAISDRQVKTKYIEIAVSILNQKPTEKTEPLRNWALDVVQSYSEIKLSDKALAILKSTSLSETTYLTDESGNFIVDDKGSKIRVK